MTKAQRANETTYNAGHRKGRITERRRIMRMLAGRVDAYNDNCPVLQVIRRIKQLEKRSGSVQP